MAENADLKNEESKFNDQLAKEINLKKIPGEYIKVAYIVLINGEKLNK